MAKPVFPYDSSTIIGDMLMTWAFPIVKAFRSIPVTPANIMDIPENLDLTQLYTKFEKL